MKWPEVTQLEFLNALAKPQIKIIKYFAASKRQRGQWEDNTDPPTIKIAWKAHDRDEFGHDMTDTLIHEIVHHARSEASERWVKQRTARLYLDDKVRAEAAIKLLDATYWPEVLE